MPSRSPCGVRVVHGCPSTSIPSWDTEPPLTQTKPTAPTWPCSLCLKMETSRCNTSQVYPHLPHLLFTTTDLLSRTCPSELPESGLSPSKLICVRGSIASHQRTSSCNNAQLSGCLRPVGLNGSPVHLGRTHPNLQEMAALCWFLRGSGWAQVSLADQPQQWQPRTGAC